MTTQEEARSRGGLFVSNSNLARAKDWLIDLIFPPSCNGCGRVDTRWCHVCADELDRVPIYATHLSLDLLDGLWTSGHHRGKLQEAIQALKYHRTPALAEPLGARLVELLRRQDLTYDIIIPVPLFADREQKRGYNQAYLLSQQVASMTGKNCQPDLLIRHRNTPHQVGLTAPERRENVRDAFQATDLVEGRSILLIDDVATTGSTLEACASALLEAGANKVYGITVSHS